MCVKVPGVFLRCFLWPQLISISLYKDFAVLTHSRGLFTSSKSATDTPESVFCFLLRHLEFFLCDFFFNVITCS